MLTEEEEEEEEDNKEGKEEKEEKDYYYCYYCYYYYYYLKRGHLNELLAGLDAASDGVVEVGRPTRHGSNSSRQTYILAQRQARSHHVCT